MLALNDFPPPAIYDHEFVGRKGVIARPLYEVQRLCKALGVEVKPGEVLYACSWFGPIACTIIITRIGDGISKSDQAKLLRVENANCNGWPKAGRE